MTTRDEKPMSFSTFRFIANLNVLAIFSAIPFAVLLAFIDLATASVVGLGVGACSLLLVMTDDGFQMGYEEGIAEAYEEYLEEEAEYL